MTFLARRTATPPTTPAIPVLAPGQPLCSERKPDLAELAELAARRRATRRWLIYDTTGPYAITPMARPAETTSTSHRSVVVATAAAAGALALALLAFRHFRSDRVVGRRSR